MPIPPVDLYKKYAATDAKALVSFHALAVLNIHLGEINIISQAALSEYLNNLTFKVLSQENDKIFMSFSELGMLVNDLLEQFVLRENAEIVKSSAISEEIRNQLKTNFKLNLSPEMKIQRGEGETETELKLIEFSTPLKKGEIEEIYNEQKENFLKTELKINQTDLETATGMADANSEALIEEINQLDFQNSDFDTSFTLSNTRQERIDVILEKARSKVSSLKFPGEATVEIPNDLLYPLSQIKIEDIYIDDSLKDILYPCDPIFLPQPSTDDRKDFELHVSGFD